MGSSNSKTTAAADITRPAVSRGVAHQCLQILRHEDCGGEGDGAHHEHHHARDGEIGVLEQTDVHDGVFLETIRR